jgi:hypothetical protein
LTFNVNVSNPLSGNVSQITYSVSLLGANNVPILPSPTTSGCPTSLAGGAFQMCTITFSAPPDSSLTLVVTAHGTTRGGAINVTATANVTASYPQILNATVLAPPCYGVCNGAITVSATGAPQLSYSWSTGATTSSVNNLCPGTYTLNITDGNGCVVQGNWTLPVVPQLVLNVSANNATCFNNSDGNATVVASGGTSPYTYLWNDTQHQTTVTATGLAAGYYCVTVTDKNLCNASKCVTVGQPPKLDASTPSIPNVSCYGGADANVTVVPSGGTPPYSCLWSNGQTSCNGTGLSAGVYNVTVTDANKCSVTVFVLVPQPSAVLSVTVSTYANATCFNYSNGNATVLVSGGNGGYTYLWNDTQHQTTATATGLAAGYYCVLVTDIKGCSNSTCVTISQPPLLSANTSSQSASCNGGADGSATVVASGGTAPYSYLWSNGQTLATATGLAPGLYNVTVTDKNNCSIKVSVVIGRTTCICTYTQGYWKTHAPGGTASSVDPTWIICGCAQSPFYSCGNTWLGFLEAAANGNAIIISAKQYIAAYLNLLKLGIDPLTFDWSFNTTVGNCFNTLRLFYNSTCTVTKTRTTILRSQHTRVTSSQLIYCGNLLDLFNNGNITGAPHC